MSFWELVKGEIRRSNTTQEWVSRRAGISFDTFRGWIAHNRLPKADDAVHIAMVLGTTVEYLVTGKDPSELPARVRDLCRDLDALSDDDLAEIRALVSVKIGRAVKKERHA